MKLNPLRVSLAAALVFAAVGGLRHAAPSEARFVLDESMLPPVNRFRATDLDPSRSACTDFAGHVNAKWVASNPIPGDRTTWGAFEMLAERSLAIQKQLAEQVAARGDARGVEKIVGDLYATGLDETKINAQGIRPLAARLAAIDALTDGAAVAGYIRQSYAKGEGFVFDFGPESDFAAPGMVMAYAVQAGLGLPDKSYYVDADKKDKLEAYERHVAKVLALSGISAPDADARARQVVAMETRLARASKSNEEISRDVSLYYNPVTPAEADKLTPNFPWSRFFAAQGLPSDQKFSLAIPAFHQ
jgi:putative endopeptidase